MICLSAVWYPWKQLLRWNLDSSCILETETCQSRGQEAGLGRWRGRLDKAFTYSVGALDQVHLLECGAWGQTVHTSPHLVTSPGLPWQGCDFRQGCSLPLRLTLKRITAGQCLVSIHPPVSGPSFIKDWGGSFPHLPLCTPCTTGSTLCICRWQVYLICQGPLFS